jgi:hypothetical protein
MALFSAHREMYDPQSGHSWITDLREILTKAASLLTHTDFRIERKDREKHITKIQVVKTILLKLFNDMKGIARASENAPKLPGKPQGKKRAHSGRTLALQDGSVRKPSVGKTETHNTVTITTGSTASSDVSRSKKRTKLQAREQQAEEGASCQRVYLDGTAHMPNNFVGPTYSSQPAYSSQTADLSPHHQVLTGPTWRFDWPTYPPLYDKAQDPDANPVVHTHYGITPQYTPYFDPGPNLDGQKSRCALHDVLNHIQAPPLSLGQDVAAACSDRSQLRTQDWQHNDGALVLAHAGRNREDTYDWLHDV